MRTRDEVLQHLLEASFGHGNVGDQRLRAKMEGKVEEVRKMADRLLELAKAESNFGWPKKPFETGPDQPDAIRTIEQWRVDEQRARDSRNVRFFELVGIALEYLSFEEQSAPRKLGSEAREPELKRLTALTAYRMIRAKGDESLPSLEEVIDTVEQQLAANKWRSSPLATFEPGACCPIDGFTRELELLRARRTNKEINWHRIKKDLWLLGFLPGKLP